MTGPRSLENRLRRALVPATAPGIDGLVLHRPSMSGTLGNLSALAGSGEAAPYWAFNWGGGLALARHVLDHRETVAGRRVLDLGTGSGLVAIVAAQAGAASVAAVDIDPLAVAVARLNAEVNGVILETAVCDPTQGGTPDVDVVLVGDVFYEATLARKVARFLAGCRRDGLEVLVGDPGRAPLPCHHLRLIAEYDVVDFGSTKPVRACVYGFEVTDGTSDGAVR